MQSRNPLWSTLLAILLLAIVAVPAQAVDTPPTVSFPTEYPSLIIPVEKSSPPTLILYTAGSRNGNTVTVGGSVTPGTAGTTITRVDWNWGDGSTEEHIVPNTHTYTESGTFTVTVTAFQSDGASASTSLSVIVILTPTPRVTVPPTLRLVAPAASAQGESIVVEGTANPGTPDTTISRVS